MSHFRVGSVLLIAFLGGACLSTPSRPTVSEDAALADAEPDGRRLSDGSEDADIDARSVGTPLPFPPAAITVNITGGLTADVNRDGIDDAILLSDTGDSATAGVYVLLGRSGVRLPDYHQVLSTGEKNPLAVAAAQLDGGGGLDLAVFAVDNNTPDPYDNESYLLGYLHDDSPFAQPLVNWVSQGANMAWHGALDQGEVTVLISARLTESEVPSLIGVHEWGAFTLSLQSWSSNNFTTTGPQSLGVGRSTGAAPVSNLGNPAIDDLIIWTDITGDMLWLVNDGTSGLSSATVNALVRGPKLGAVYDLNGVPPMDVIGVFETEIQAVPVDTDGETTSVEYNGQSYIDGVAAAAALLVFDSDPPGAESRPEILLASPACADTADTPCLYLIRNAYMNGTNDQLNSPSVPGLWALPAGFVPRVLLRGAFTGGEDDEVVVFGVDGSHHCVHIVSSQFSGCE